MIESMKVDKMFGGLLQKNPPNVGLLFDHGQWIRNPACPQSRPNFINLKEKAGIYI